MNQFIKFVLIFLLIMIVGGVLFVGVGSKYFKGESLKKISKQTQIPLPEMEKFPEFPENFELPNSESKLEKEPLTFVSPDEKFTLNYDSDWRKIKPSQRKFPQKYKKKYNLKCLLLAQKLKKTSYGQLMVTEGEIREENLKELLEFMKESNQEKGWKMEIIDLDSELGMFEAKYSQNQIVLRSKERILFSPEKFYLVGLVTLIEDWAKWSKEAETILSSTQLVK